jgi:hypothetical protein
MVLSVLAENIVSPSCDTKTKIITVTHSKKNYYILWRQAAPSKSGIIFVNNPQMRLCKNPPDVLAGLFGLT